MTPAPSRKRFGYPVFTDDLVEFCSPGGTPSSDPLRAPFSFNGRALACNGYMAIRLDKFAGELPPENRALYARVAPRLPTGDCSFEPDPRWVTKKEEYERTWRSLDDVSGLLWQFGAQPAFFVDAAGHWHLNRETIVRVGHASLAYLPLLQLLARLPRAQISISAGLYSSITCRFNGGVARLAPWAVEGLPLPPDVPVCRPGSTMPKVAFTILPPRRDLFTGSPIL